MLRVFKLCLIAVFSTRENCEKLILHAVHVYLIIPTTFSANHKCGSENIW